MFIAVFGEDTAVFLIDEMANFLEHGYGVGAFFGELSEVDELLEDFVYIGQVKVSREHQVPGHPIALPQERVGTGEAVLAIGSIAQMPEQQFTGETDVVAEPLAIAQQARVAFCDGRKLAVDAMKDVLNGLWLGAAIAADIFFSWCLVELNCREPSTVLAAVVLLLHQQVHLVEAVEAGSVLFSVILKILLQANQGNATLVLDRVTHRFRR